jgi:hypothetical protein
MHQLVLQSDLRLNAHERHGPNEQLFLRLLAAVLVVHGPMAVGRAVLADRLGLHTPFAYEANDVHIQPCALLLECSLLKAKLQGYRSFLMGLIYRTSVHRKTRQQRPTQQMKVTA